MIKYKLICKNCDLLFDSWFSSSKEYEKLKKKNFLNCHNCNSKKVEKTLMAPQLMSKSISEKSENKTLKFKYINKKMKMKRQQQIRQQRSKSDTNFMRLSSTLHDNIHVITFGSSIMSAI